MVILWSDIRHALRTLLKSPGFSLVAILSLALAIGANTTVFSLLNTILLRKLPVPHPDQLVQVFTITSNGETGHVTIPAFRQIESSQQVFSSMFCWWDDVVLSADGGHGVTKSGVHRAGRAAFRPIEICRTSFLTPVIETTFLSTLRRA